MANWQNKPVTQNDYYDYYYNNVLEGGKNLSSDIDPETGKSISQGWKDSFLGSNSSSKNNGGNSSGYGGGSSAVQTPVNNDRESSSSRLYRQYMEAIRAQQEAAEARLRAQINAAVGRVESQKPVLGQQFGDSAQQAYVQSMLSKRDLPQQLAAQGISGGASESANLAIDTTYGNAYNNLQRDYNNNLASLDADIANIRANGDVSIADNANTYAQKMAEAALQYRQQLEATGQSYLLDGEGRSGSSRRNGYRNDPNWNSAYDSVTGGFTSWDDLLNDEEYYRSLYGDDGFQALLLAAE